MSTEQDAVALIDAVDRWLAPARWLGAVRGGMDPASEGAIVGRWINGADWSDAEHQIALALCHQWRQAAAAWQNARPPLWCFEAFLRERREPARAEVLAAWRPVAAAMERDVSGSSIRLRRAVEAIEQGTDGLDDWPDLRRQLLAFADRVAVPPEEAEEPDQGEDVDGEGGTPGPRPRPSTARKIADMARLKTSDPSLSYQAVYKAAGFASAEAARKNWAKYGPWDWTAGPPTPE